MSFRQPLQEKLVVTVRKFVPLTESVSVWAKTLSDALQQNERNDNTKLITEHHYNIAFEAKKLQERYLQLAGEVK